MSRSTSIKWTCLNCKKIEYKPLWLAKRRRFCQPRCRSQYILKQNPDFYKDIGSKADPAKTSITLKTKGIVPPSRLGAKHSEEYKKHRSKLLKEQWASGVRKACLNPKISSEGRRRKIEATQAMRQRLAKRGKLTDIEKIIDNYLHSKNIRHEHEYPVGRKSIDFYLPAQKIFIEADGDYWHQDKTKDIAKDIYVRKRRPDVKIIRCSEIAIKNGSWIKLLWGAKRGV